jgi:hypothetical protein
MFTIAWGYLKSSVNVLIAQFETLVNIGQLWFLTKIKYSELVTVSATGLMLNLFSFQKNILSESKDSEQPSWLESHQNLTLSYNEKEVIKITFVSCQI